MCELYASIEAALNGSLQGKGTLGTLLLCESLLSFLPSGSNQDQPTKLLKAYEIVPLNRLHMTRRIDLREHACLKNGVLYIKRPTIERVWIPTGCLPTSARATAAQMLRFMEQLKAAPRSRPASKRAAQIIVTQFKHDLFEMRLVTDMSNFDGKVDDQCVADATTAEEYVTRVFVPENLPSEMSVKSCLTMAQSFGLPNLLQDLGTELLNQTKMVPRATVHARSVTFSASSFTLVLSGDPATGTLTSEDAHRLVAAADPMLVNHFPDLTAKERKLVLRNRPRLSRCVKRALRKVWTRLGYSCRHLIAIAAVTAIVLAETEELIPGHNITRISRAINLNRYIKREEIEDIVRHCDETDDEGEVEEGESVRGSSGPRRREEEVEHSGGTSSASRRPGTERSGADTRRSGAGTRRSGAGTRRSGAGTRRSGACTRRSGAGTRRSGVGTRRSGAGTRRSGAGTRRSGAEVEHSEVLSSRRSARILSRRQRHEAEVEQSEG